MRILSVITVAAVAALVCGNMPARAHKTQSSPPILSPQSLEALVAGVAFYPDAVIERILDAAQYPEAIRQAVAQGRQSPAQASWAASVQYLLDYPEILRQLDRNREITAQLALAAQIQLADVWAAIDRVRAQFEASREGESSEADGASSEGAAPSGVVWSGVAAYPRGAFIAGFWTAQVVQEIRAWYPAATVAYAQGAVTVTGPAGNSATITGSGGAANPASASASARTGPSAKGTSSMARPGPAPPRASRFNGMSRAQIQAATGGMAGGWGGPRPSASRFSRPSPPAASHVAHPSLGAGLHSAAHSPKRSPTGRSYTPSRRGAGRRGRR